MKFTGVITGSFQKMNLRNQRSQIADRRVAVPTNVATAVRLSRERRPRGIAIGTALQNRRAMRCWPLAVSRRKRDLTAAAIREGLRRVCFGFGLLARYQPAADNRAER